MAMRTMVPMISRFRALPFLAMLRPKTGPMTRPGTFMAAAVREASRALPPMTQMI